MNAEEDKVVAAKPAAVPPSVAPTILTRENFSTETSESVRELYPDNGWEKFVTQTLVKVNADQQLQTKGGIYLNAIKDSGRKIGVAAVRWEPNGDKAYSMLIGLQWEITAFVNAMLNTFSPERPNAKERAARRKKAAKKKK